MIDDHLVNSRNVFTRYIEDQQTYDALDKGLPYSSIRNGDQQSLEKFAHRRLSHAEGWPKNLPPLRIELLLETQSQSNSPGACGEYETGAAVQTISRVLWPLFGGRAGVIVDNFCKKARVSNARPFMIVRTRDEVDMQWARAAVSAGLPMIFKCGAAMLKKE